MKMLWQRALSQSPCGVRMLIECNHRNPHGLAPGSSQFSKTWVGRQRLQKEIQEYRKKIYVNVLIVGAVILLYICINGKVQIEKGINMRHILELWNGYCNLIFNDVKDNLFYLNEPLSDKTYIMHGTLSACLSWLMTGAGAVRYLNKYTEDPVNVVLSGRDVLFLINRGSSSSYNSVYTAQNFSALDFCKNVLETFRESPKGWSEYTKGSNRTAEEIETEPTRLADEMKSPPLCGALHYSYIGGI